VTQLGNLAEREKVGKFSGKVMIQPDSTMDFQVRSHLKKKNIQSPHGVMGFQWNFTVCFC